MNNQRKPYGNTLNPIYYDFYKNVYSGLTVNCKEIDEVVAQVGSSLRDGTKDLFQTLHEQEVPILVFSAGLGDVVTSVLKYSEVYLKNVKVFY